MHEGGYVKVKKLIDILKNCDPERSISCFANNHYFETSRHTCGINLDEISVAERGDGIVIGNFSRRANYPDQFYEKITKWHHARDDHRDDHE